MCRKLAIVSAFAICLVWGAVSRADSPAEPRVIKICRVGSSSFNYELFEQAKAIAEASGRFRLVSGGEDHTGYTRLDDWVRQPGLYEEWCGQKLPLIQKGHYDYVIVQTIGWCGMTPAQQMRLCDEFLPDLMEKIHGAGAQVILYDKFIGLVSNQEDPRARTWGGRYPDAERLNCLLHIYAAKKAGIEKITFGGNVVNAMRGRFKDMGFLYEAGHPGVLANYISALELAHVLTGQDVVGNDVRDLPLQGWARNAWEKIPREPDSRFKQLYEANKGRIHEGVFTLRDEEARVLQEAAMASQKKWGGLLRQNLDSDQAFAKTVQEIKHIQNQMGKYADYGLDAGAVARLTEHYAPASQPGGLTPVEIKGILRRGRSIDYADIGVRNFLNRNLTRDQIGVIKKDYVAFWDESNSKLRDDVKFEAAKYVARMEKGGDRDEVRRMKGAMYQIGLPFSLSAYKVALRHLDEDLSKRLLSTFKVHSPAVAGYPYFTVYVKRFTDDRERLAEAWDVMLDVWTNPELMDELKKNKFATEVIRKADDEFKARIEKKYGPSPADAPSSLPGGVGHLAAPVDPGRAVGLLVDAPPGLQIEMGLVAAIGSVEDVGLL